MKKIVSLFIGQLLLLAVMATHAVEASADQALTPYELVDSVTGEILVAIEQNRQGFDQNPAPLLDKINQLLDQMVDFNWIAANVMGPYRKQASQDQISRFAAVFRQSLVETYSRGLLSYSDEKIVLIPPAEELGDASKATVRQEIHGTNKVYPLQYTMAKNRDGEWKILNMVINGINLGKTFRNQFVQAAQKNRGDIDKVIDDWVPEKV